MSNVNRGRVLVVDDDELVLKSTARLLRSLGYDTLTAVDGAEAVAVFEERCESIDLVLLDMVMPNLGGTQTYHILRKLDPRVRVLLTSGYSDHQNVEALLDAGAHGFLPKPLQVSELQDQVAAALGARRDRDGS